MELSQNEAELKYIVDWDQFQRDTKALAWKLKPLYPIGIVAISRGGLVPAALLAYELNIKFIDTLCISSYTNQQQTHCVALKESKPWNSRSVVVVDDLVDTGDTFTVARRTLPLCHYASVYAKPKGKNAVDTYVTEVSQDTWIYFPWDQK